MCNDGSCTLRCKALFLAGWSLGHGLLNLIFYLHQYQTSLGLWFMGSNYFIAIAVFSALSVVGGILMLVAIFKNIKWLHLLGLVLSWGLPVVIAYFIYPLVIHIVFTICACRYYNEMR
ncbi:PREDICTED: uncharacterized protein LOC108610138 [Drosophila arizonae]|uniref:Uncharacterized protein LOC108610138 n=1 Tax=Drosophila arizonae TaxID=7263 RepID=A0ABM1NRE3_DROAR|nr:PREDICTED: uncharacterized protein LOC108610138 [Drosophila arizonae]